MITTIRNFVLYGFLFTFLWMATLISVVSGFPQHAEEIRQRTVSLLMTAEEKKVVPTLQAQLKQVQEEATKLKIHVASVEEKLKTTTNQVEVLSTKVVGQQQQINYLENRSITGQIYDRTIETASHVAGGIKNLYYTYAPWVK